MSDCSMVRPPEDKKEKTRIDVNSLPESLVLLWDTMLRHDPHWDLAKWLDKIARQELEMVELHFGRERLRLEQRLHRIENLVKSLNKKRQSVSKSTVLDPYQKNLFDIYSTNNKNNEEDSNSSFEESLAVVDFGSLTSDDDPLLSIVSEHIRVQIEEADFDNSSVHFEELINSLKTLGIRSEEVDEALSWLLQNNVIIELEQDVFGLNK